MINNYNINSVVDLIEQYKEAYSNLLDTGRFLGKEDLAFFRKEINSSMRNDFKIERKNSKYFVKRFFKKYKKIRKKIADKEAEERLTYLLQQFEEGPDEQMPDITVDPAEPKETETVAEDKSEPSDREKGWWSSSNNESPQDEQDDEDVDEGEGD